MPKLRWQDRVPDTEVLERTRILSIHAMLRQLQLRWSGHLVMMDDNRLPKQLFYGDIATDAHQQGSRTRRHKDTLKRLQINLETWIDLALDRPAWRGAVKTGAIICEANRVATAKAKGEARNSQASLVRNANPSPLPICPHCQRTFRA
ncbi:hypothetical protein SprV_0301106200 [Sparganum proliferum]